MEIDDDTHIETISDDDMDLDKNNSETDLDVPKEYSRNKRKRNKLKNKVTDINILRNNDKTRYEIEKNSWP
jgi:hypothetical protein